MAAACDHAVGPASVNTGEPARASAWVSIGRHRLSGVVQPAGLALTFADGNFTVRVTDTDGEALVVLGPYPEEEIVAVWRSLAAKSGLPLLLAGPDGTLQQLYRHLGRLRLGDAIGRSRLEVLSGRRPRFLVRRKSARMPLRPLVYREREIATGRGA